MIVCSEVRRALPLLPRFTVVAATGSPTTYPRTVWAELFCVPIAWATVRGVAAVAARAVVATNATRRRTATSARRGRTRMVSCCGTGKPASSTAYGGRTPVMGAGPAWQISGMPRAPLTGSVGEDGRVECRPGLPQGQCLSARRLLPLGGGRSGVAGRRARAGCRSSRWSRSGSTTSTCGGWSSSTRTRRWPRSSGRGWPGRMTPAPGVREPADGWSGTASSGRRPSCSRCASPRRDVGRALGRAADPGDAAARA